MDLPWKKLKFSLNQVWDYEIYHLIFFTGTYCVFLITCSEYWSLIKASLHDTDLPSFQNLFLSLKSIWKVNSFELKALGDFAKNKKMSSQKYIMVASLWYCFSVPI